jgi:hypothetical protein
LFTARIKRNIETPGIIKKVKGKSQNYEMSPQAIKRTILISTAIILSASNSAWANPVVYGPPPYITESLILGLESLLVAIILYRLGFKPLWTFFSWLPITWITFILLVKFIAFIKNAPFILTVATGELCVILLEALALYLISLSSFFYRSRSNPLEPLQAIKLSTIVNIASLLMGFLLLFLSLLKVL